MSTAPTTSDSTRVAQLVERFRTIGDAAMRDLPLYNPRLEVEAVGFRPLAGAWVGVLITPWFMNLIRLPQQPAPMDMGTMGRKVTVALPAGDRELMQGGDEEVGSYESLSLHSPMFAFEAQDAARQEAEERLAELMSPQEEPDSERNGKLTVESQTMNRRAFLRGARPET